MRHVGCLHSFDLRFRFQCNCAVSKKTRRPLERSDTEIVEDFDKRYMNEWL